MYLYDALVYEDQYFTLRRFKFNNASIIYNGFNSIGTHAKPFIYHTGTRYWLLDRGRQLVHKISSVTHNNDGKILQL